jgi:hypothetical protein
MADGKVDLSEVDPPDDAHQLYEKQKKIHEQEE